MPIVSTITLSQNTSNPKYEGWDDDCIVLTSLSPSPDGKSVFAGGGYSIWKCDIESGDTLKRAIAHNDCSDQFPTGMRGEVAVAPDNTFIVTVDGDFDTSEEKVSERSE